MLTRAPNGAFRFLNRFGSCALNAMGGVLFLLSLRITQMSVQRALVIYVMVKRSYQAILDSRQPKAPRTYPGCVGKKWPELLLKSCVLPELAPW